MSVFPLGHIPAILLSHDNALTFLLGQQPCQQAGNLPSASWFASIQTSGQQEEGNEEKHTSLQHTDLWGQQDEGSEDKHTSLQHIDQ